MSDIAADDRPRSTVRPEVGPKDARAGAVRGDLTPLDLQILQALRRDARIPNNALAAQVGVAPSTCHTRVRKLERDGVIRGYHAEVDLEALGTPLQAMVSVRVRAGARHLLRDFTGRMTARPEVLDVYFLAGVDDFLVHLAVASATELRDFVLDQLSSNPEVASTQTNIVFDHVRVSAPDETT